MNNNISTHKKKGIYEVFFKRFIDVTASVTVVILFSWLYLLLAILVRVFLGAPIIFTQERPGKNGTVFKLYKFRSMSDKKDENDNLLPDKQRLNRFGRILRSTSLDELPELFNIIKGEMSLIGPRPLLVKYYDYYNDFDRRRHEVRPGLTGLAQVSGRNNLTWKEKFEKDIEYVDNITFLTDVKIVMLTVKNVIKHEGITFSEGHQTIMQYFEESKNPEGEKK